MDQTLAALQEKIARDEEMTEMIDATSETEIAIAWNTMIGAEVRGREVEVGAQHESVIETGSESETRWNEIESVISTADKMITAIFLYTTQSERGNI